MVSKFSVKHIRPKIRAYSYGEGFSRSVRNIFGKRAGRMPPCNEKKYKKLHCVHMKKTFCYIEISLVDKREFGDWDNEFPI